MANYTTRPTKQPVSQSRHKSYQEPGMKEAGRYLPNERKERRKDARRVDTSSEYDEGGVNRALTDIMKGRGKGRAHISHSLSKPVEEKVEALYRLQADGGSPTPLLGGTYGEVKGGKYIITDKNGNEVETVSLKKKTDKGKAVLALVATLAMLGAGTTGYYIVKEKMGGDNKPPPTPEKKMPHIETFEVDGAPLWYEIHNNHLNNTDQNDTGILAKYINADLKDDEFKNATVGVDVNETEDSSNKTSFVKTTTEKGDLIAKNVTRALAEKIQVAKDAVLNSQKMKAFQIDNKHLMGQIYYAELTDDERNATGIIDRYFDDNKTNGEFKVGEVGVDFGISHDSPYPTSYIKSVLENGTVVVKNITRALAEKIVDAKAKVVGAPVDYEGKGPCTPSKIYNEKNLTKFEELLKTCGEFPTVKLSHDASGLRLLTDLHNEYKSKDPLNGTPVADVISRWNTHQNDTDPDYIMNVTFIDTPDDAPGTPIGGGSIMIVRERDGEKDTVVLSKEQTRIWRDMLKVGG